MKNLWPQCSTAALKDENSRMKCSTTPGSDRPLLKITLCKQLFMQAWWRTQENQILTIWLGVWSPSRLNLPILIRQLGCRLWGQWSWDWVRTGRLLQLLEARRYPLYRPQFHGFGLYRIRRWNILVEAWFRAELAVHSLIYTHMQHMCITHIIFIPHSWHHHSIPCLLCHSWPIIDTDLNIGP